MFYLLFQVMKILTDSGAEKYKPFFAKKNIAFKELSFADDRILKQVSFRCLKKNL